MDACSDPTIRIPFSADQTYVNMHVFLNILNYYFVSYQASFAIHTQNKMEVFFLFLRKTVKHAKLRSLF